MPERLSVFTGTGVWAWEVLCSLLVQVFCASEVFFSLLIPVSGLLRLLIRHLCRFLCLEGSVSLYSEGV